MLEMRRKMRRQPIALWIQAWFCCASILRIHRGEGRFALRLVLLVSQEDCCTQTFCSSLPHDYCLCTQHTQHKHGNDVKFSKGNADTIGRMFGEEEMCEVSVSNESRAVVLMTRLLTRRSHCHGSIVSQKTMSLMCA